MLVACSSNDSDTKSNEPIKYIDNSELNALYTNPKKFKNKNVKLTGRVFSVEEDNFLQVFVEVSGDEKNTIIADYVSKEKFKEDDIIYFEGVITDEFKGENALGGEVSAPVVEVTKV